MKQQDKLFKRNVTFNQIVYIYLTDGTELSVGEDTELPIEKTIAYEYMKGNDEFLKLVYGIDGYVYIPKKNILYIRTGDLHEALKLPDNSVFK